ncbi:MAG: hypothetical protein JJU05_04065 [Verrucomicrobia bacterium]|nr:hypothetical protein [Verrucomicrobiota bacterium]
MQHDAPQRSLMTRFREYPGHLKNLYIWKTGFCRRLRAHDPVLVYQMGKVGSRSIHEPLQACYPGVVVHAHRFAADYPQGEVQELYRYWHSASPPKRLHLISLVRNPVDRNVSAFFQNFKTYTGYTPEQSPLSLQELLNCFLETFPHHIPAVWFENQFRAQFNIDVFSKPFPEENFQVFPSERTPALLLKLETPDDLKTKAVRDFLHLADFHVIRANDSEGKDYSEIYKSFKASVRLPERYVKDMISSDYFRHFYSDADAEKTMRKWCGAPH